MAGPYLTVDHLLASIEKDGELIPGFSGIGALRGIPGEALQGNQPNYNDDELTIINHFFTNPHSNVYCARDNMPDEFRALLMAQFARSPFTARDRFLKLFYEVQDVGGERVHHLAYLIRVQKDIREALEGQIAHARSFISYWGVDYGHSSIRDSGIICIFFEGVSQLATKYLESAREGAYQEESTRILPFRRENLGIPYEIQGTPFEQEMRELDDRLISLKERIEERAKAYLRETWGHLRAEADAEIQKRLERHDVKLSDKEWDGVINAQAFDISRSLIPQNMTTSLGVTLNTRRFQDQLTEWQSSDVWEVAVLGRVAQIESMKVSPELMKYGNRSDYHAGVHERLTGLRTIMDDPITFPYQANKPSSKLIATTPDLEDTILASILLNASDGRVPLERFISHVKSLSSEGRREIARAAAEGRSEHDIFSKIMECGTLTFERLYDIGAYRDLQRHRGDRQQRSRYSCIGYVIPREIKPMGMQEEFESGLLDVKAFYDRLVAAGLETVARNVPVMANILRHVVTMDPVQQFYQAGLRTQPAGIHSYRSIGQQEIGQTLDILPSFRGLITYDSNDYPLARLPEAITGKVRKELKKQAMGA